MLNELKQILEQKQIKYCEDMCPYKICNSILLEDDYAVPCINKKCFVEEYNEYLLK